MDMAISGVVLAGGASRRMGVDKATLSLGSRTLLEIVVERLGLLTRDMVVAAGPGPRTEWPQLAVRTVPDEFPDGGPLAGFHAGLRAVAGEAVVVVACDMPFFNVELLRHMVPHLGRCDAVVPVIDGRRHPLHGVYSRHIAPAVDEMLRAGGSFQDLLNEIRTEVVTEEEVQAFDPAATSCFNVNYPEDLQRARALWERLLHQPATAG